MMLERLLGRDVALPSSAEIAAELARRGATVDGLPEDWSRFTACGRWMRLQELEALKAAAEPTKTAGKSGDVLMVEKGVGVPLVTVSERGGIAGPLVEAVHRRASIRYLLAGDGARRGRRFECVAEFDRGWSSLGRDRGGCTCLVAAIETAEVVEMDLARAVVCARGLAKRAHRSWLRASRAERRRAARARRRQTQARRRWTQATPTSRPRALVERSVGAPAGPPLSVPDGVPSPAPSSAPRLRRLSPRPAMSDADVERVASIFGLEPGNVYDASRRGGA